MIIEKYNIKFKGKQLRATLKYDESKAPKKAIFFIGPIYANYDNNWGFLDRFTNNLHELLKLPVYSFEFVSLPLNQLDNKKQTLLSGVKSQFKILKKAYLQFTENNNFDEIVFISQSFGASLLLKFLNTEIKVKHKAIFLAPVFKSILDTHYFNEIKETNKTLINEYLDIAEMNLKLDKDILIYNIGAGLDAKNFKEDFFNFNDANLSNDNFESLIVPNADHGWNYLEMVDNNFSTNSSA